MSFKSISELKVHIFFAIYLLIGLFIYKDFGIGIEEHFQRQNGFFWLNHFLSSTNFDELKLITYKKYNEILISDPYLPDANFFNFYGIIFDLPLAFIEVLFNIESSKLYFEIRHLFNFLIFFISSIFFYKILRSRFRYLPSIYLGTITYIISPRIFGDSFHNNKDLLLLSFLVISIYYAFKLFDKFNYKNLILFCLFAAFATSSRIFGVYLPFLIIFFILIEYLCKKIRFEVLILRILKIFFFFILFLYLHYPYMWKLNPLEISSWLSSFFYSMDYRILFNGEYYNMRYLPRSYLPVWMIITTPLYISILFFFGLFFATRRLVLRTLNIKEKIQLNNDFWSSNNEKKDVFIILSFFLFFFYVIFFNVFMVSGWRYFYFLNIFIIYIFAFGIYKLRLISKAKLRGKIFVLINLFFVVLIIFETYRFHPYQSLYFNELISSNNSKKFQIDTPSLSRSDALRYILSDSKKIKFLLPIHLGHLFITEKPY